MAEEGSLTSSPVKPGDVLAGRYRVDVVLGTGPMGVVVAVTRLESQERFALRFIPPSALSDHASVERFIREARATVRIKSAHAARVVDVGTMDTGSPYMVMELVEGEDLGKALARRGRLEIDAAADVVLQSCEALAEAHVLGIVHRDLRPASLLLTTDKDGERLVKVLDFGISKMSGRAAESSGSETAEVPGSSYMAPERQEGARGADERSDVWSLGVILFEALAGEPPFRAESVAELAAKVRLEAAPRVKDVRGDVPDAIDALIARCLEKDPGLRPPSVADIAEALDPFAPDHSRGMSVRIRRVASMVRGRSVPPPSMPVPTASPSRPPIAPVAPVAQVATERSPTRALGSTTLWVALCLAVAVAGGVFFFSRSQDEARAVPSPAVDSGASDSAPGEASGDDH